MNRHERRAAVRKTLRIMKGGRHGQGFATSPEGRLLESFVAWGTRVAKKEGLDDTATVAMMLRAAAMIGAQRTGMTAEEFSDAARVLFDKEAAAETGDAG